MSNILRLRALELQTGKSQVRLASEIKKTEGHVRHMRKVWESYLGTNLDARPKFNIAYQAAKKPKKSDIAEREEAVKRLAEARDAEGAGMSEGVIAETLGASRETIQRDMKKLADSSTLNRPSKIRGRDGKASYQCRAAAQLDCAALNADSSHVWHSIVKLHC